MRRWAKPRSIRAPLSVKRVIGGSRDLRCPLRGRTPPPVKTSRYTATMPSAHRQRPSSRSRFRARRTGRQRRASSSAAGSYPSRALIAIRHDRRRQRDGARAPGVVRVEAGRSREPLERLCPLRTSCASTGSVEGFECGQRSVLVVLSATVHSAPHGGCRARRATRPARPPAPGPSAPPAAPGASPRSGEHAARVSMPRPRPIRQPSFSAAYWRSSSWSSKRPKSGRRTSDFDDELGQQPEVGAGDRARRARDRSRRGTQTAARTRRAARRRAAATTGRMPREGFDAVRARPASTWRGSRRCRSISSAISAQESIGHPRGGELDAERHAATSRQIRSACEALVLVEGEAGPRLCRPLDERARERASPAVAVLRESEPFDVVHPLALHVEAFSRGGRGARRPAARSISSPSRPDAVHQVLEVVEHEQRRALAQVVEQLLLRREAAVGAVDGELDSLGDGRREEAPAQATDDERHEVHAVRVALDPPSRRLEREPRLADPPGPTRVSNRQSGSSSSPSIASSSVARPTNDVPGEREALHPRLERFQKREVGRQPVDLELEDAARARSDP